MDRWTKELSNVIQNLAHQKGVQIQKEKSDIKATECKFSFSDTEFTRVFNSVESPPGNEECSSGPQTNQRPRVDQIASLSSTSTSLSAPALGTEVSRVVIENELEKEIGESVEVASPTLAPPLSSQSVPPSIVIQSSEPLPSSSGRGLGRRKQTAPLPSPESVPRRSHRVVLTAKEVGIGDGKEPVECLMFDEDVGTLIQTGKVIFLKGFSQDVCGIINSLLGSRAGKGLVALKSIKGNQTFGDFGGTEVELSTEAFKYVHPYMLEVNDSERIRYFDCYDYNSGYGRFMNDPFNENLSNVKIVFESGRPRMFALRDIEAGEELLMSYGREYWSLHCRGLDDEDKEKCFQAYNI